MKMPVWSAFSACFALATLATGCREKATPATADPTPAQEKPKITQPPPKPVEAEAVVVTNRIEIPRIGHDPIVLQLPTVQGIGDVGVLDKVNAVLAPENILGESLDDVRVEAKSVKSAADLAFGVQGASYSTPFFEQGVLEVEASVDFMGAYPSTNRFHALVDLRTGASIGAEAFLPARVPGLVKRLDAMLKAEVKGSAAAKDPDFASLVHDAKFEAKDLGDLSPSKQGLTFAYDYAFPHVALALQPDGRFFLPWSDVAADLDPKGPLARIHPVP